MQTYQFDILKPSKFIYPDDVDSIAVFKRDLSLSDTCTFYYQKGQDVVKDTNITYSELSNTCVDALANYLNEQNYFKLVTNYSDSSNYIKTDLKSLSYSDLLFQQTKSDCCIFLDFLHFENSSMNKDGNYFETDVQYFWTLIFKNDSNVYVHKNVKGLIFDEKNNPNFQNKKENPRQIILNTAQYIGDNLGAYFFPNWENTSRVYYKSKNADMLKAEKYALANDWMKAAEIWKIETKNKNPRIVAKACFNLALACEMEGKLDLGIDWLIKSYSSLKVDNENNVIHKENCSNYITVLALRQREIKRLQKQIRDSEIPVAN